MRCGFVLYNYSIRKNITNKPFSLGANAFPCNLQTYEEQQVSLKQQVTYKCKHWLIVNARLNVIHTSQFQLVNLGNTTRKKILVCKKVRGQGGGTRAPPALTVSSSLWENQIYLGIRWTKYNYQQIVGYSAPFSMLFSPLLNFIISIIHDDFLAY